MCTHSIHLCEPHQNQQNENQTTARGLRMGSHRTCAYKKVLRFKYISTFPTKPMTKDDVAECVSFLVDREILGMNTADELRTLNVKALIEAKVKAEGKTINERQSEENVRKHAEIEPYLDAFRRSTVTMSKQKGAKLFEDPAPLENNDGPASPEHSVALADDVAEAQPAAKPAPKKAKRPAATSKTRTVACQTDGGGGTPSMRRSKPSKKQSKQASNRFTYNVKRAIPALAD